MKKIIIIILISITAYNCNAQLPFFLCNKTKVKDTLTIAILGQSNAGQRGNVANLADSNVFVKQLYTKVRFAIRNGTTYPYNSNDANFQSYNKTSGYFGAELGLVNKIYPYYKVINVVQFFVGSNSLHVNFNPSTAETSKNQYYYGIWNSVDTSYLQQVVKKYNLKINVFVWIQGEQDAIDGGTNYSTDLPIFINSIRTHYGSNVLFVYNQLITPFDQSGYETGKNLVRSAQSASQSSNNLMVNMDDIGTGDIYQVHYGENQLITLGKRFGQSILNYYK